MSKRIFPSLAALSVLAAQPAFAADMPALRGPVVIEAPLAKPAYDWSGFYIGGQAGVMTFQNRGRIDTESNRQVWSGIPGSPNPGPAERYTYNFGGAALTYGFYAGALAQYGLAIFGFEADINGPMNRINGPVQFENPDIFRDVNTGAAGEQGGARQRIQSLWDSSLRARFGIVHGATLFYGTGGLALGSFRACSVYGNEGCTFTGAQHRVAYTRLRLGWTLGLGIEHKFNHSWSVRAEYRYTNYGVTSCLETHPCFGVRVERAQDIRNRLETHAWRVGLTYTFAAPLAPVQPVIARN